MDRRKRAEKARIAFTTCACHNIRKASRAITQFYDEKLRPSGLRVTQFNILGAALALEPVTISRLAKAIVTDRTTLTRNLKLLEKQGLVRLASGKDRRQREITVTADGRRALAKAYPLWREAQVHILNALGPKRWQRLLGELSTLVDLTRPG